MWVGISKCAQNQTGTMKKLSVEIGYEVRSVELTETEWESIQRGETLARSVDDSYEGETVTYEWQLNSADYGIDTLVVTYDDAVGFKGSIEDGWVEDV